MIVEGFRMRKALVRTSAVAALSVACVASGMVSANGRDTVTMSGNAYAFIIGGNNDRLEGAVIGIEEFPDITTVAGPNGAYSLQVPNHATITPYVEFPGYYPTHIQTFHTVGQDLRQVNFQVPELGIYRALAGITGAKIDPETGLLEKCAIVSTFFEIAGRQFRNFNTFHDFHPHGVPGSTATQEPASGRQFYFNKNVIPDPDQETSSRDGGVLWADVEAGTYKITGSNPDTRFARFQATCEPGRLVNANPPWGLYQLSENEVTNLATKPDTIVDARVKRSQARRQDGVRRLQVNIATKEAVTATILLTQNSIEREWTRTLAPGRRILTFRVPRGVAKGRISVRTTMVDQVDNTNRTVDSLAVPRR